MTLIYESERITLMQPKIVVGDLLICSYLIMVISTLLLKMSFLDNIAVVTMGHLCGHCKVIELSLPVLPGERH